MGTPNTNMLKICMRNKKLDFGSSNLSFLSKRRLEKVFNVSAEIKAKSLEFES